MRSHRAARIAIVALVGAAVQGCSPELPPPDVLDASPDWAYNGESTEVLFTGQSFFPAVSVDLARQDPSVDLQFQIHLVGSGEEVALEGVEMRSTRELNAFVPEGHVPGTYDIQVTSPQGQVAILEQGFTITDTRADHLALEWALGPYAVQQTAIVTLRVEDPNDSLVPVPLEVEVQFSSNLSESGLEILDTGLDDQVIDGKVVRGVLPPTGESFLAVTSTKTELLEFIAVPADPESVVTPSSKGFLSYEAGSVAGVQVELPDSEFQATAGTAFPVTITPLDSLGNALQGEQVQFSLSDEKCFGQVEPSQVELTGPASVSVTFFRSCPSTRLVVAGDANGGSTLFSVASGPVDSLVIQLNPTDPKTEVIAGQGELELVVEAVDAFGNHLTPYDEDLEWVDDVGGLSTLEGVGEADCSAWALGTRSCTLALEVAFEGVTVSAFDQGGYSGTLPDLITVLAAEPAVLTAELTETEHVAGGIFTLHVSVVDSFGNVNAIDPIGVDAFTVDDGYGTTICSWDGQEQNGDHRLLCAGTTASTSLVYEVSLPSYGLTDQTDAIGVVNGSLNHVVVTGPSTVTAGDSFGLSIEAYDAWDNPFMVGNLVLQVTDDSGGIAQNLTLASDGTGALSGISVTLAGSRTIEVSQNNIVYGSEQVEVEASSLSALSVAVERPWAWIGEEREVIVSGIDSFGNVVPTYAGPVTLSSKQNLFGERDLNAFSDGVAITNITWDSTGLEDRVEAYGPGGESGQSTSVDSVETCNDGPTADLELADDGLACLVAGTASLNADLSSSTAGSESISAYHLYDGQSAFTRGTGTSITVSSDVHGGFLVEALVVDAVSCAELDTQAFWVNDAGEPAGPVSVSPGVSTIGGGSSSSTTTVTVATSDCAGDVPTASSIYVRTDLGELTGVTQASDGLTASLGGGSASFTWSGQNLSHDGTATIYAGTLNGGAYGSASLEVTGEDSGPQVTWMDPSGTTDELFDTVTIGFTEELLAVGISDESVTLEGPNGEVDVDVSLDVDELLVEVEDGEQDAGEGEWSLLVKTTDVRDDSGNKLDGDWTGNQADFVWTFGDVQDDGIAVDSCSGDLSLITPDGSSGSGDEADEVVVTVTGTAKPHWWRLVVTTSSGERVRSITIPATATTEYLDWDARGDDGAVVEAGTWTLSASAIDAQGNVSTACSVTVEVRERYRSIE